MLHPAHAIDICEILTIEQFEAEVLDANAKMALVSFVTDWSGESHMLRRTMERIAEVYADLIRFYLMDGDSHLSIVNGLDVHRYPTIVFFKKGELLDRVVGLTPRIEIITKIERLLNT